MARILVTYATKHHSTEEIAEAIAAELRERGHDVDCLDAGDAGASGYDAVVLGSAVYMGRWRREARRFLKHERDRLSAMPFWVFSTGPAGQGSGDSLKSSGKEPEQGDRKDDKWLEPARVIELAESLGVREHVVFGGRLPTDPSGFVEKAMVRDTPPELMDLRNWDEIRGWAASIADALAPPV